ncbi:MAG: FkbM family methyltransferase [Verrucomicrobia bacterium]|nr:FkbM family methyltransferase [Verrucomicrobiota bacterium]
MSALLSPVRFLRDARRILRLKDAPPGAGALFKCWLSLQFAPQDGPLSARLGPLTLHAHNREELSFLFEEVFVKQDYLVPLDRPDPVIVDCGANLGFATLYFKLSWPGARIMCFEPNPSCFQHLERHVTENGLKDVTLVQAACGKSAGEISFFVNPGFSPLSSIHGSRSAGAQEIKVKLVKLSDYITGDVDLFKLDVEGAEWDIMDDLIATGKIARIQRMAIEYHHRIGGAKPELSRFLKMIEDAGFTYDIEAFVSQRKKFTGAFQDMMILASRPEVTTPRV